MKAVILAGGLGTRLQEETVSKPKPMVEIGGMPIIWHIMKIYSSYEINDFIVCCGYKGYMIKEYFKNYLLHQSDITIHLNENKIEIHKNDSESWKVTLIDTGENTMTGGRIKRIKDLIADKDFCLTYGDGLSDVNINDLIDFHKKSGKEATLTAVYPPGRFGALHINNINQVKRFVEKPRGDGAFINGGFFVLSPSVIDRIEGDQTIWEQEPLSTLANDNQLMAFQHNGFWQPMDTLRDKDTLENLWKSKNPPWKIWEK